MKIAIAIGALSLATLAEQASAQWTYTNLMPRGAQESVGYDAGGGQQAGYVYVDGVVRASLWIGTPGSWIDLNPADSTASQAFAASGGQQGGSAVVSGIERASLWSGTSASWVDLHPAGAAQSRVMGIGGAGQQVGHVRPSAQQPPRASLWNGTAASRVDLHPAGSTMSIAYSTNGRNQAGFAVVDGSYRASLWSGTAASWVDLNPAGSTDSVVSDIDGDQQVGYAWVGWQRASLWSGTAASWVDLSPPGVFGSSQARGARDGLQVGYVFFDDKYRASLWSGTADSWVDLSAFLPADYMQSEAWSISSDGVNRYITGFGVRGQGADQVVEAWLLTQPILAPCAVADLDCDGSVNAVDLATLLGAWG
jgi:hypothetical protein